MATPIEHVSQTRLCIYKTLRDWSLTAAQLIDQEREKRREAAEAAERRQLEVREEMKARWRHLPLKKSEHWSYKSFKLGDRVFIQRLIMILMLRRGAGGEGAGETRTGPSESYIEKKSSRRLMVRSRSGGFLSTSALAILFPPTFHIDLFQFRIGLDEYLAI